MTQRSNMAKAATMHPEQHEEYSWRSEWRRLCGAHDATRGSACSRAMDGSFQRRLGLAARRDEQLQAV